MTARQINNVDVLLLASPAPVRFRGGAHHSINDITLSADTLKIKIRGQNLLSKELRDLDIHASRLLQNVLDELLPLDHQREIA
jgi:hypothetical protein